MLKNKWVLLSKATEVKYGLRAAWLRQRMCFWSCYFCFHFKCTTMCLRALVKKTWWSWSWFRDKHNRIHHNMLDSHSINLCWFHILTVFSSSTHICINRVNKHVKHSFLQISIHYLPPVSHSSHWGTDIIWNFQWVEQYMGQVIKSRAVLSL